MMKMMSILCLMIILHSGVGNPMADQGCNCHPKGTYAPLLQPNEATCDDRNGQCPCLPNVVGQYCDRCEDGYFNIDSGQGCEPCDCDSMGSYNWTCDAFSGKCDCRPGITGPRCDLCGPNHYGFAMDGCRPCNCDPSGSVHLSQCDSFTGQCHCKDKVGGRMCDQCQPGYWNFPNCQQCECNGHADSCDPSIGQCINCRDNTHGEFCDQCKAGYYGDAINSQCRECQCDILGTDYSRLACDRDTGACNCLPNVEGHNCDVCRADHWKFGSGEGCEPCECDPIGSTSNECHLYSGQCNCKPGFWGVRCDKV